MCKLSMMRYGNFSRTCQPQKWKFMSTRYPSQTPFGKNMQNRYENSNGLLATSKT